MFKQSALFINVNTNYSASKETRKKTDHEAVQCDSLEFRIAIMQLNWADKWSPLKWFKADFMSCSVNAELSTPRRDTSPRCRQNDKTARGIIAGSTDETREGVERKPTGHGPCISCLQWLIHIDHVAIGCLRHQSPVDSTSKITLLRPAVDAACPSTSGSTTVRRCAV